MSVPIIATSKSHPQSPARSRRHSSGRHGRDVIATAFSHTCTLAQYLGSALDAREDVGGENGHPEAQLHENLRALLRGTIVGTLWREDPESNAACPVSRTTATSAAALTDSRTAAHAPASSSMSACPPRGPARCTVFEVITHALETIFRRCPFAPHNVLAYGCRVRRHMDSSSLGASTAIQNYYPNTLIETLQGATWTALHALVGDAIFFHLLTETALFIPAPRGCYIQLCGPPVFNHVATSITPVAYGIRKERKRKGKGDRLEGHYGKGEGKMGSACEEMGEASIVAHREQEHCKHGHAVTAVNQQPDRLIVASRKEWSLEHFTDHKRKKSDVEDISDSTTADAQVCGAMDRYVNPLTQAEENGYAARDWKQSCSDRGRKRACPDDSIRIGLSNSDCVPSCAIAVDVKRSKKNRGRRGRKGKGFKRTKRESQKKANRRESPLYVRRGGVYYCQTLVDALPPSHILNKVDKLLTAYVYAFCLDIFILHLSDIF